MYKIRLQQFEGPLDLLLFFIKRDELDIYDIPISYITKEFISYVALIKQLDLEAAGDFILMASTLMQIKVRMLLPRETDDKGEEIDPRADLVKALLEYKRYKEMTEELALMESNQRKRQFRGYYDADEKEAPPEFDALLKNITLFDLMKAFRKVLEERPKGNVHQIRKINVSIEQQIDFISEKIEAGKSVKFFELVKDMREKIRIVVTFIALLEMVKMGKLGLRESINFNDFELYSLGNG
ncbi:MAG: segregation/condensation protein A [Melioribacteraceae bacterium]|nr:segregation/condensation protein A [Melioribacteraceae bacterium]MDD3557743.1 segregation/condensation protein A [Melioribacteraceae bacterium]